MSAQAIARRTIRASVNPLTVQLVTVLSCCLTLVLLASFALAAVQGAAGRAKSNVRADLLAEDVELRVAHVQLELARAPKGDPRAGANPELPVGVALSLDASLRSATESAAALHELVGAQQTLELFGAVADAEHALTLFLASGSGIEFEQFRIGLEALARLTAEVRPDLAIATEANQDAALAIAGWTRWAVISTTGLITVVIAVGTWWNGRRLGRALDYANHERLRLAETSRLMERRNGQFQALYQVVIEVSETLSMKYVVRTAVTQARRLVGADMVALRLVRSDLLSLIGSDQDVDGDVVNQADIKLGEGVVGRVAKRGKISRIDSDAEALLGPGEGILGASSGLVVPLIVGARVIGTLECWGRAPGLFDEDDEQILEMMASQVATAVVAADTHEATDHQAHHDALTSLPNRRQLARQIREDFGPALQEGKTVSFAMVDIDHFKRFNDEFGHKVGDVTLQRVAEVLRASLRSEDHVYRYGGEEFTIVLEGVSSAEAEVMLERVRAAMARTPLTGENLEPVGPVTISIGLATGPEHGNDCEELIKLADAALYQSKWAGRDRLTVHTPGILEQTAPERVAA